MSDSTDLTVVDLQKELTAQDYDTLTLATEEIATRCLLKAKMVVKGMILSTGHTYDEGDDLCRMCVLKRGRIELFIFNGQHEVARQEEEDLELVIKTNYGSIITKSDNTSADTGPAVAVIKAKRHSPLDDSYGHICC